MEQASSTLCSSTIGWSYPLQRAKNASTTTKFAFILLILCAEWYVQVSFEGTIRTSRLLAAVDALCGWTRVLGLWIANFIIYAMNLSLVSLLDESLSASVANAFPDHRSLAKESHFVLATPILFVVSLWLQNIYKFIVGCQPFVTAEFDGDKTSATVSPNASSSQPAIDYSNSIIKDTKTSRSHHQQSSVVPTVCDPLLSTIAINVIELEKKTPSTYTPKLSRSYIRNIKPTISITTVVEPRQAPARNQSATPSKLDALNTHVKFNESTLEARKPVAVPSPASLPVLSNPSKPTQFIKPTPSLYIPKKNAPTKMVSNNSTGTRNPIAASTPWSLEELMSRKITVKSPAQFREDVINNTNRRMNEFESSLKLGLTEYEKVSRPIKALRFKDTTSVGTDGTPLNSTLSQKERDPTTSTRPVLALAAESSPVNSKPEAYSVNDLNTSIGLPIQPIKQPPVSLWPVQPSLSKSQPPKSLSSTPPFQSISQSLLLTTRVPNVSTLHASAPSSSIAAAEAGHLHSSTEAQDTDMQDLSVALIVGKTVSTLQPSSDSCIQIVDCEMSVEVSAPLEAPQPNAAASEDAVMSDHAGDSRDTQMDINGERGALPDVDMGSEDTTTIADVEMDASNEDPQVAQTLGDIPPNVVPDRAEILVGNSMALGAVSTPDRKMGEGNELALSSPISIPSPVTVPVTADVNLLYAAGESTTSRGIETLALNVPVQTAPVYPSIDLMGHEETRHSLSASTTGKTVPLATRTSTTSTEELLANETPAHTTLNGGVQRTTSEHNKSATIGVGGTTGTVVRDTARQEPASSTSKQLSSSSSRPSLAANAIWTKRPEETQRCSAPINSGEANLAVTVEPRKVRRSAAEEAYLKRLEMEEAEEELEEKKKRK